MKEMLTLEAFEEASEIVKKVTADTSLVYSEYFSSVSGNKVYLKPENMQATGAYKIRGAYYKISTMSREDREKGLITASAGNHAQGVAYAAKKYGCKATIVMPTTTPLIKVNRTRSYGADVILKGDVYDESCAYAMQLAQENGYTFVHPFDDPTVATGQGTIMMEIFKDLPLVEYVLVPVGGGGLATGVSTLAKLLNPNIKVIAVEPAGAACLSASMREGKVVTLPSVSTIADGTAVKTPGEKVFPYLQKNIDDIITVEDDELIVAFLDMVENHKMIVENSGLLTVAALKHLDCRGKRVVSVLSGGEQSRLRLCILMRDDINFLMLDEPTNHLDLISREWMEDALLDYSEALLFVSHDRWFIEKFATRIWYLHDGTVEDFKGGFTEWREYRQRQESLQQTAKAVQREKAPRKKAEPNRDRRRAKVEKDIEKAEAAQAALDAEMAENASDYQKLMELEEKKAALDEELEELYAQWEELCD